MSAFIPSSLYGVIGWPLAQSLSPLLHNTAFQALGIPAAYMLWELPPEKLPQFVDSMRLLGIRGCSVTLPHKVEILPLLCSPDLEAAQQALVAYLPADLS